MVEVLAVLMVYKNSGLCKKNLRKPKVRQHIMFTVILLISSGERTKSKQTTKCSGEDLEKLYIWWFDKENKRLTKALSVMDEAKRE